MIKQFFEGAVIGLVLKGFGKSIFLWILILITLMIGGLTIFMMEDQGSDLSILYTIFGYIGKILVVVILFKMYRALVRNWKLLIAFLTLIVTASYMPVLTGHGDFQDASLKVLGLVIPLVVVWIVDKFYLKFKTHRELS